MESKSEDKGQNVSKDVSPEVRKSKLRPLSSNLLRNTAATAAKSKASGNNSSSAKSRTPLAAQKLQPSKLPMLRKATPKQKKALPTNDSSKKVKKLAVSSFIVSNEPEDHLPDRAEWDASAIAGPNLQSSISSNDQSVMSKENDSVLVSSSSIGPRKRQALMKYNLLANKLVQKPRALGEVKAQGPIKVTHHPLDNTSQVGLSEDFNDYDEYLMSELMKFNAVKGQKMVQSMVDKEITSLWSSLEFLKSEVSKRKEFNEEVEQKWKSIKAFKSTQKELDELKNSQKMALSSIKELAQTLDHCRNRLELKGTSADENQEALLKILKENVEKLDKTITNNHQRYPDLSKVGQMMENVKIVTAEARNSFERCKSLQENVNKNVNHLESLKTNPKPFNIDDFAIKCAME